MFVIIMFVRNKMWMCNVLRTQAFKMKVMGLGPLILVPYTI